MSFSHVFHPSICRANDIRGVVGETLTERDAYAIGRGVATMVVRAGGKSVAVGRDGRDSSQDYAEAVCEGIVDAGISALNIGLGPSPMLYFANRHLNADGAVMVTGSHNPPDYNGFKLLLGTHAFHGTMIDELADIAVTGSFATGRGKIVNCPVRDDYAGALLSGTGDLGENVCAWDPGNGAAGVVLQKLLAGVPGTHFVINDRVDGGFPAHHPDPSDPANLAHLKDLVLARHCDVGFAFDGDGDRLGVIDATGRIVWPDQYLALLAMPVLNCHPGATIISDVKASDVLFEQIARAGGQPDMWKTGHALVKQRMHDTISPLAGEMSGHIFFADRWFGFDDALYGSLRLLEAMHSEGVTIAEFVDRLPRKANTPEIRFECADRLKFGIIDAVTRHVAAMHTDFVSIDGVRVKCRSGWWLLRASNTEPALVARCEADDEEGLMQLKEQLATVLNQVGVDGTRLFEPTH